MKYIKQEKIDKIKLDKNNMYVVIDFDKTITATDSEDSWDATGRKLSKEFKKDIDDLYEKYMPVEINYKLPYEEKYKAMETWYNDCMNLYYTYSLTKEKLEESVIKSKLKFRKGAKEFLKNMHESNVPIIIISAGIGNTIELFLEKNNSLYKNMYIISNFIKFDKNGNMEKFKEEIIHSMNKNLKHDLPKFFKEEIGKRKYSLLLGDVLEDLKMIPEEQIINTITVNFLNEKVEENLKKTKENFDIVLTGEDACFETVQKIVFK